ncbi:unnamed protein product [Brassica oleracea var. botrytis]|uniref:BnaC04g04890D protein n=3 Tax=Brassica TaxID=3705 RepID=A0A078G0N3_BRANA|nr:PREDICTED: uncharacterized protein At5g39865-like [Brassica oleracea var. oleracea]XP_013658908.1 uncharacterized protein At5g39865 [Brassica napus]KAH0882436.1 hypothetical protein HID58_058532 [Brassica napus]CAF1807429.1 unnamed protein product [Brassica napus]CDY18861.1 BnaC04g04890D [Brassica napus]
MLWNWFQLRKRRQEVSPDTPKWSSRRFSCSSFKDVNNLLYDDDVPSPELQVLHQPRSPKIDRCTSRTPPLTRETLYSTDQGGVVLYYTSLRIVRKTFEECRAVRAILHRLRIPIDDRDLTMDARFHDELHAIFGTKNVELPKVFIGGRYIGGADEIKKLNESGELRKMVGELPPSDGRFSENCELCGGWRFVVCERCNGSHKIFLEENGFVNCTVCSVEGLVRCSSCFPIHRTIGDGTMISPVDLK